MREISNFLMLEDVLVNPPSTGNTSTAINTIINTLLSPTIKVVEGDCGTTVGNIAGLDHTHLGAVLVDGSGVLTLPKYTKLKARKVNQIRYRDISTCVSKLGVCRACFLATTGVTTVPVRGTYRLNGINGYAVDTIPLIPGVRTYPITQHSSKYLSAGMTYVASNPGVTSNPNTPISVLGYSSTVNAGTGLFTNTVFIESDTTVVSTLGSFNPQCASDDLSIVYGSDSTALLPVKWSGGVLTYLPLSTINVGPSTNNEFHIRGCSADGSVLIGEVYSNTRNSRVVCIYSETAGYSVLEPAVHTHRGSARVVGISADGTVTVHQDYPAPSGLRRNIINVNGVYSGQMAEVPAKYVSITKGVILLNVNLEIPSQFNFSLSKDGLKIIGVLQGYVEADLLNGVYTSLDVLVVYTISTGTYEVLGELGSGLLNINCVNFDASTIHGTAQVGVNTGGVIVGFDTSFVWTQQGGMRLGIDERFNIPSSEWQYPNLRIVISTSPSGNSIMLGNYTDNRFTLYTVGANPILLNSPNLSRPSWLQISGSSTPALGITTYPIINGVSSIGSIGDSAIVLNTNVSISTGDVLLIKYYTNSSNTLLSYISKTFSGGLLGMSPLDLGKTIVKPSLFNTLIPTAVLNEARVDLERKLPNIPIEYLAYCDTISDVLEKALLIAYLYIIYYNVI